MRRSVLLALMISGCVGSYDAGTPGTPGTPAMPGTPAPSTPAKPTSTPDMATAPQAPAAPTARQLFDTNVSPMLLSNCSSCHAGTPPTQGPTFLGAGQANFYANLKADSRFVNNTAAQSLLLTKGAHEGPAWSQANGNLILAWLTQEIVENPGLPAPPPPTNAAEQQLQAFAKCMTITDFNASGMKDLQNQTTVGDGGSCYSCHQTGMYVFLSTDATANFNHLNMSPWILKFAVAAVNPDGSFQDIVAANRFRDRGQETGHPAYTLTQARQTALTTYFQDTYTKYKAGNCVASNPDMGP
jgi:hypothetical protein